jgi:GTP cyclohydrolase I
MIANYARQIDRAGVESAARDLLLALGADADADGLEETPRRVADAYAELLTPHPFRATTFPNDEGYDELIVARALHAPPAALPRGRPRRLSPR